MSCGSALNRVHSDVSLAQATVIGINKIRHLTASLLGVRNNRTRSFPRTMGHTS